MKKLYEKPVFDILEFRISNNICLRSSIIDIDGDLNDYGSSMVDDGDDL